MCKLALATLILGVSLGVTLAGYPYITPTTGSVWPAPKSQTTDQTFVSIKRDDFEFSIDGFNCTLLQKAVDRYAQMIADTKLGYKKLPQSDQSQGSLTTVSVNLVAACEGYPEYDMKEDYQITVDTPDKPGEAEITSYTLWGIMRGLETFTHLLVPDGDDFRVNSTQIVDSPRFHHRGLMIDTARHFVPLKYILQTVDLLSMNKMNVLHWHITDDQSFPYQSKVYPDLSTGGSFTEKLIYTAEDLQEVVDYATERGIRVIPEFDTPGHTKSWGPGQPGLLTPCYSGDSPDGTYGPIDPSKEENYDFLKQLFTEVGGRFLDHYLHLGGDEVPFGCWNSNPDIAKFMNDNNLNTPEELESYYITKLLGIVSNLPTKNGYLVWQEVFDNGVDIANDTIVHVWKNGGTKEQLQKKLAEVTAAGYQTLLSTCWYLNYISYGTDWHKYYECDPRDFSGTDEQKDLVIGGEACMWAEYVDKTNLIARTWPRASVVAEKLWSPGDATTSPDAAAPRLEEQRCRLLDRGYMVESLGPSFCQSDYLE